MAFINPVAPYPEYDALALAVCKRYYSDSKNNSARLFEVLCFLEASGIRLQDKIDEELGEENSAGATCYTFDLEVINSKIIGPINKEELDAFVAKNRGEIAMRFFESLFLGYAAIRVFEETIHAMKKAQMSNEEIARVLEDANIDINDKTLLGMSPKSLLKSYKEDAKPYNSPISLLQKVLFDRIHKTEVDFFFDKLLEALIEYHHKGGIGPTSEQISGVLLSTHPELVKVIYNYYHDDTPDHKRKELISYVIKRTLIRGAPVFSSIFNGRICPYPEAVLNHLVYSLSQLEKGEVQPKDEIDLTLLPQEPVVISEQEREFFNTRIDEVYKQILLDSSRDKLKKPILSDGSGTQHKVDKQKVLDVSEGQLKGKLDKVGDSNNFWRNTLIYVLVGVIAILGLGLILRHLKRPASFAIGESTQAFGLAVPGSRMLN